MSERLWDDDQATLEGPDLEDADRTNLVPCLTIVAHPQLPRVGERYHLHALQLGRSVALSRHTPEFGPVGGRPHAPLEDRSLSRRESRLRRGPVPGAIDFDPCGVRVIVSGREVREPVVFGPAELQRGVLLTLAKRVALLLHRAVENPEPATESFIGHCPAFDEVRRQCARVAGSTLPVLILGETGTGKELVAHRLHGLSRRPENKFLAINMATLNPATAASTLFGHRRGSFTGAEQHFTGMFEQAHGGTLFLDEVGETPPSVQGMLLRTLETGTVLPLGDTRERRIDVRVIAATEQRSGASDHLRTSLLHRLAGAIIRLPPLRERWEDIPRLFASMLLQEERSSGNPCELPADVVEALLRHPFHGNIRELRNLARRYALEKDAVRALLLNGSLQQPPATEPRQSPGVRGLSPHAIVEALRAHDWSPARAARHLGVPNSTFHYWMRTSEGTRRATDLSDPELSHAAEMADGDIERMARVLQVSVRALQFRLRRIGPSR